MVRDKNGNYQFEVPSIREAGQDEVLDKESMSLANESGTTNNNQDTLSANTGEDARLAEAVKYHLRDRNRQPSEPAGMGAAQALHIHCSC